MVKEMAALVVLATAMGMNLAAAESGCEHDSQNSNVYLVGNADSPCAKNATSPPFAAALM